MISKETMRIVLTAARDLLNRRESRVQSLQFKLEYRNGVATSARTAGARTTATNDAVKIRAELEEATKLAAEVREAIEELCATEVGAEVWKELENDKA